MQFSRAGESLWQEWEGEGFEQSDPDSIIFYTIDHVDMHHEVVRRAAASYIQRDGIVDGIGDAYRLLEGSRTVQGFAGYLEGDNELLTVCDKQARTMHDESVEVMHSITWVEVFPNEY